MSLKSWTFWYFNGFLRLWSAEGLAMQKTYGRIKNKDLDMHLDICWTAFTLIKQVTQIYHLTKMLDVTWSHLATDHEPYCINSDKFISKTSGTDTHTRPKVYWDIIFSVSEMPSDMAANCTFQINWLPINTTWSKVHAEIGFYLYILFFIMYYCIIIYIGYSIIIIIIIYKAIYYCLQTFWLL